MYRGRRIINGAFHTVDRGCIAFLYVKKDNRMPNGGGKMCSKSKQKKQREDQTIFI